MMFGDSDSYCEKCWEDPCKCGYYYRDCPIEWLDERIAVLTKARDERQKLCDEGNHGIIYIFVHPPISFAECIPAEYQARQSHCKFCRRELNE